MIKFKPFSILILTISLFLSFTACDCIEGEGPMRSENRLVEDFSGINLSISANVIVTKSDKFSFEVRAQENLLPLITSRVVGNELRISTRENCFSSKGIEIFISMPEVEELRIGGSGSIVLEDHFTCERFDVIVSGSGDIEANISAEKIDCEIDGSGSIELLGDAEDLKVVILGSGDVEAMRLIAEDVKVKIYGSGDSRVFAKDYLKVYIAGSGNVKYRGKPDIDTDIDGSGSLIRLK